MTPAAAHGKAKGLPPAARRRFEEFEDYLRQEEPGLGLRLDETTDSARITGSIKVDIGAGVTRSFAVEIRFEGRDPFKTPRVWDAGRRFRPDGERHVEDHVEGWRFCLELDAAPDIDFADEQGLQSLLQNLRGFIVKQIMYEERLRRGHPHPWPGHAWDHGTAGHVEWLSDMLGDIDGPGLRRLTPFLKYRRLSGNRKCPCGSGEKAAGCHRAAAAKVRAAENRDEIERAIRELEQRLEAK